ncbi:MAG: hypothetical protein ACK4FD_13915 [Parvibaculum sp.]
MRAWKCLDAPHRSKASAKPASSQLFNATPAVVTIHLKTRDAERIVMRLVRNG